MKEQIMWAYFAEIESFFPDIADLICFFTGVGSVGFFQLKSIMNKQPPFDSF